MPQTRLLNFIRSYNRIQSPRAESGKPRVREATQEDIRRLLM